MSIYEQQLPPAFPYMAEIFPEQAEGLIHVLLNWPDRPHKGCSSFAITADSKTTPNKVRMWLSEVSYRYLQSRQGFHPAIDAMGIEHEA